MIYILLLAHFLSDFLWQSNEIVEGKMHLEWKAYGKHFWHHIATGMALFLLFYTISNITLDISLNSVKFANNWEWEVFYIGVVTILLINIVHIIVDQLKVVICKDKYKLLKFGIDQVVHIAVIYYIGHLYYIRFWNFGAILSVHSVNALLIILGVFVSTHVVSFIIDIILESMSLNKDSKSKKDKGKGVEVKGTLENNEVKFDLSGSVILNADDQQTHIEERVNASSVIGYIERIIIIVSLLAGLELVVVAVVGFKTLISFNVDRKISAEYFIIGNLLSIGFAVLTFGMLEYLMSI